MYLAPISAQFVHQKQNHFVDANKKVKIQADQRLQDYWLSRLARTGGRQLAGDILDEAFRMPDRWRKPIKDKLRPWMFWFQDNTIQYADWKGKRFKLGDYFKKTVLIKRFSSVFWDVYERQMFTALGRCVVIGLNTHDILKNYHSKDWPAFWQSVLRWTIGTEIGNIGFAIGYHFQKTKTRKFLTGFLLEALMASLWDYSANRTFKRKFQGDA